MEVSGQLPPLTIRGTPHARAFVSSAMFSCKFKICKSVINYLVSLFGVCGYEKVGFNYKW
jgi:hypothetical protein